MEAIPSGNIKEKILIEARQLFWKYGVRTITMDEIARRLAISKKTIYQHFTDKEDIVYQVMEYQINSQQDEYCRINEQHLNPIDEMLLASEMMRQHAGSANPSLMIDVQRYFPKAWQVFLNHKEDHIIGKIMANLQRGVEQGFYRTDINIETMARLRIELIQLGFDDMVFPHQRDTYLLQDQLLHHFVRGILTEAGFDVYNQSITRVNAYNPISVTK